MDEELEFILHLWGDMLTKLEAGNTTLGPVTYAVNNIIDSLGEQFANVSKMAYVSKLEASAIAASLGRSRSDVLAILSLIRSIVANRIQVTSMA